MIRFEMRARISVGSLVQSAGHGVDAIHDTQSYDAFVRAAVTHYTHGLERKQGQRIPARFSIPVRSEQLVLDDLVCLSKNLQAFLGDFTNDADSESRDRERDGAR